MVLHIDTDYIERYGLDIRELWVLTALMVLTCRKPWRGTYEQLAQKIQCGSKASAQRAMQVLIAKGLVIETEDGFITSSQNETSPSQNETSSSQNETESKDKRKEAKEKRKIDINEDINNSSRAKDIKSQQPQPLFFNDFVAPSWDEIVKYATEKQIPVGVYTQFFAYYEANGWLLKRGGRA